MADAQRLDVALVARGLSESRERAQEAIKAGMVLVNGKAAKKASQSVTPADDLQVTGDPIGFVSRGGLKLQAALDTFAIHPVGHVCLDVGASTGGFTHVLLDHGAAHVYSVDVGHGQLHPTIAADSRVHNLEGTDIRKLAELPPAPGRAGEKPDLCVVDVSFISLTQVLPGILPHLARPAQLVVLVKPQFEVGPDRVGKGGIVRLEKDREQAIMKVRAACTALGLQPRRHIPSPVLGTEGNQEYLLEVLLPV